MIRETRMLALFAICFLANVSATKVESCENANGDGGKIFVDDGSVSISRCSEPPCIFKKKTSVDIVQDFTAPKDVKSLRTIVFAKIGGVFLPFIGVNGMDARDHVTNPDGSKANFPLVRGQGYTYKNSFPVLSLYPSLSVEVHWSLSDGDENITCFKVAAKITS